MDCVLAALTETQCLIYIDDIIVFSRSFPEHLRCLMNFFKALRGAGLKLTPSKCHFAKNKSATQDMQYLLQAFAPTQQRQRLCPPIQPQRMLKGLRQFLGFSNYYRRFAANYSKIAEPLHKRGMFTGTLAATKHLIPSSKSCEVHLSLHSLISAGSLYCIQMHLTWTLVASSAKSRMAKND